jgi:hypothetical protein
MRAAVAIFLVLLVTPIIHATEFPRVPQIIQTEGKFVFTDGSSYYMFKKDGTFTSEPLGISGREITGKWEYVHDREFVIRGRWSWMNGLSPRDDYRQMTIAVFRPISSEIVDQLSGVDGTLNVKVYKCYFVIEELIKIPKPTDLN